MKNKETKEYSIEELGKQKKTLGVLIAVLGILILLYAIYFIVKLSNGTWDTNNTLGITGIGILIISISIISIQMMKIDKEIKSRT